jgi:hypothetical protein
MQNEQSPFSSVSSTLSLCLKCCGWEIVLIPKILVVLDNAGRDIEQAPVLELVDEPDDPQSVGEKGVSKITLHLLFKLQSLLRNIKKFE